MPTIKVVHGPLPDRKVLNGTVDNTDAFSVQVRPIIHPCLFHQAPGQQTHQYNVGVWVQTLQV